MTFAPIELITSFLESPKDFLKPIRVPRKERSRRPRDAWQITSDDVKDALRRFYTEFVEFLAEHFPSEYPLPCVHGYVSHKSALTNAQEHAGAKIVATADVENFFPSLRDNILLNTFLHFDLTPEGAELLTRFVTLDGSLPLGYPTSPFLSNICLVPADRALAKLADKYSAKYTRYADDMTFSSAASVPTRAEIQDILAPLGLVVPETKFRVRKYGQALYVAGYSVSDVVARAPRALKRRLRTRLHYIKQFGLVDHVSRTNRGSVNNEYSHIAGWIELVRRAEKELGEDFKAQWKSAPRGPDIPRVRRPEPITLFLDDTEFSAGETKYRGLCIVSSRNPERATDRLLETKATFLLDPMMPSKAQRKLREKGIHFADLPEDFRPDVVDIVARSIGVRAHIVFAIADGPKKEQLFALLTSSLKHRLSDQRGRIVSLVFEQGEYIDKDRLESILGGVLESIPIEQRPLCIDRAVVASKLEEPSLALADIVLGTWQRYATAADPDRARFRERDKMLYATIRRKVATIFNASSKTLFTSKQPFQPFEIKS